LPARLPSWNSCFSAALPTFLWRQMAKPVIWRFYREYCQPGCPDPG
jgi:hypothetical protein